LAASSKLVALLLTDMVESTQTRVRLGSAYSRLLREHDQLIADVLSRHSPTHRYDTGDGFLATFHSTTVALAAACDVQWGVKERNEIVPADFRFAVRIGLSAGEIYGRTDKLSGMPFVEVARLEKKAAHNEILCTDVFRLLASEQAPGLFVDPELVPFKGIEEPRRVWHVDWTGAPPVPAELPLPEPLAVRPHSVFVGRVRERQRLRQNWNRMLNEGTRLVLLSGEAGIGKSSLARVAAQELHQERARVLYGRCDAETDTPFQPFAEAVSTFFRDANCSRHLLGRGYHRLVPFLGDSRGLTTPPPPTLDPETSRYELFEAFADWLAMICADSGVLLVIDDLHLADAPTLELVRHVLRSPNVGNVCMVATCRWSEDDVDAGLAIQELAQLSDQVDHVRLSGLGEGEVREAVARRVPWPLPAGPTAAAFVRDLLAYTDGNALFVEAILADLPDDVLERLRQGAGELVDFVTLKVSEDVQELFRQRRSRLGDAARSLLDAAGVVGPSFDGTMVSAVAQVAPDAAEESFDDLLEAGLIRRSRPGGYEFSHSVIREAALQNLPATERVELALRAAREIELRYDPVAAAAELSHYYAGSSEPAHRRASADYAVLAGDRAIESLAAGVAARHYRRALERFESLPESLREADRCDLVSKLGYALKQAGDPTATDALLEAARLAQALGDAPRMARTALATLSGSWGVTGAVDNAKVEVLEAALASLGDRDKALRARLLAALAAELTFSRHRARVDDLSREAVALARVLYDAPPPEGDRRVLARVLEHRHTILLHPEGLAERRQLVAELDQLSAEESPHRVFAAAAHAFWTAMELGNVNECRQRVNTMVEIVETVSQPRLVAMTRHWQSSLAALLGQIDNAKSLASESAELWHSIGTRDALVFSVGLHYLPSWYQGRLQDVIADIDACSDAHPGRVGMRAGLAHAWSVIGDYERTAAALNEADLEGSGGHHDQLVALALSAMAAATVGELDRLNTIRRLLEPFHTHVLFNGTACFGSAELYLALACAGTDRLDEADARFYAASQTHVAMSAPALLALTKLEWAKMLLRRRAPSDGVRGRVLLEEALTIAHGLGLTGLESDVHHMLATETQTSGV